MGPAAQTKGTKRALFTRESGHAEAEAEGTLEEGPATARVSHSVIDTLQNSGDVYALAIYNDRLYSGTGVGIKVWSLSDHSVIERLQNSASVRSLAIHNDRLYSGSWDGIKVWSLSDHSLIDTLQHSAVNCLAIHNDRLYSGSGILRGMINVWSIYQ